MDATVSSLPKPKPPVTRKRNRRRKPLSPDAVFIPRVRAADMVCRSVQFVDKLIKQGRLRRYQVAGSPGVFVKRDELMALIEEVRP